jgi:hypothetical protein
MEANKSAVFCTLRTRLHCEVYRAEEKVAVHQAFNEACLDRGFGLNFLHMDCYIDGSYVTTIQVRCLLVLPCLELWESGAPIVATVPGTSRSSLDMALHKWHRNFSGCTCPQASGACPRVLPEQRELSNEKKRLCNAGRWPHCGHTVRVDCIQPLGRRAHGGAQCALHSAHAHRPTLSVVPVCFDCTCELVR